MAGFNYQVIEEVAMGLCIRALKFLPPAVKAALEKAYAKETGDTGRSILKTILQNIEIAEEDQLLICQDTGLPIYFVKIGSRLPVGGTKIAAAHEKGEKWATLGHPSGAVPPIH